MTILLAILLFAHTTGRWCSDPNCEMCNKLHLNIGHDVNTSRMNNRQAIRHHNSLHKVKTAPIISSTPMPVVRKMLEIVSPTEDDILFDLGCGDGRILIEAYKKYGCKVIGIEIKPEVVELARKNLVKEGMNPSRVVLGDVNNYKLIKPTIVTMYLFDDLISQIVPKLGAVKIVSYNHPIPGYKNKEYKIGTGTIYYVDNTWKKYVGVK